MPITDPRLPVKVLDAFQAIDLPFVVLHREPEVGSSQLNSDVDLVLGMAAAHAVARTSKALWVAGLRPALLWPYDLGGTAGLFVTTEDGAEGAQIDLLYDPSGRGRYGICTGAILADSISGVKYRVPSPLDQQLYLLRKRACKGESPQIEEHLEVLAAIATSQEVLARARKLFSPRAAIAIERLVLGGPVRSDKARRSISNSVRLMRRLRKPVGLWVELIGADTTAAAESLSLEARFGRWLIRTASSRRPEGAGVVPWLMREVSPVRLRPGLYLSWSHKSSWPRADLTLAAIEGQGLDRNAGAIVEAFTAKVTS